MPVSPARSATCRPRGSTAGIHAPWLMCRGAPTPCVCGSVGAPDAAARPASEGLGPGSRWPGRRPACGPYPVAAEPRYLAAAGAGSPSARGPCSAGHWCGRGGGAAGATLRDHPRQSGGSSGPSRAARALGADHGHLARAASHHHGGLSGPECALRRWHTPWSTAGRAGRGSLSSGQQPAGSRRGLSAQPAGRTPSCCCPHRAGADCGGWLCVPSPEVAGAPPGLPGLAAAASGGTTAAPCYLGDDLRGAPSPARPGAPGGHHCSAPRPQPPHGLGVPAAYQAPEAPQPSAGWPGLAALHGVRDPALAGGVHGQHAALARAAGAGLWPLRPDCLAFSHPAAAGERSGLAPETQASPYTRPQGPSARAVSCTGVCPCSEAVAGRADGCRPLAPGRRRERTGLDAEPGFSGARAGAPRRGLRGVAHRGGRERD